MRVTPERIAARAGRRRAALGRGSRARVRRHARRGLEADREARGLGPRSRAPCRASATGSRGRSICSTRARCAARSRRATARRRRAARGVHGDRLDESPSARERRRRRGRARRVHRGISDRRPRPARPPLERAARRRAVPVGGLAVRGRAARARRRSRSRSASSCAARSRGSPARRRAQVAERSRARRAQARRHPARAHGRRRRAAATSSPASASTSRCRPSCCAALSDWPRGAIDLATATRGAPPPRAALAARLIDGLAELFACYAETGFAPYRAEWRAADFLRGRRVHARRRGRARRAVPRSASTADGALLVETAGGARRRVISGDVSVRSA